MVRDFLTNLGIMLVILVVIGVVIALAAVIAAVTYTATGSDILGQVAFIVSILVVMAGVTTWMERR